ncbi:MAG: lysophospholipid acyltransferase family protein [Oceanococcus sp.]
MSTEALETGLWDRPFNRVWRIFGTGLSFALFGLGGLLIGVVLYPLLRLLIWDQVRRKRTMQYVIHRGFGFFAGFMAFVGVISHEVIGREKLQQSGQLIIANHPTLIDVVLLIAQIPRSNCVVKQSLFINPFTRGPVMSAGYVANNDTTDLVDRCLQVLKNGESLVVFPEGTRTTPGQRSHFRRGIANIALRAGVPLRPVIIDCQPSTLTKGLPWYSVPQRQSHITLRVEEPIDTHKFAQEHANLNLAARALTEHLQEYLWEQSLVLARESQRA